VAKFQQGNGRVKLADST